MTEATELKKMYWHSRRGMLELDLILVPFAESALPGLQEHQVQDYQRLLLEEDQDLFQWLVKKTPIPDASLQEIIDTVIAHAAQT